MTAPRDLSDDHVLLVQAVREAGEVAREFFDKGAKSWEKKPGDPVTEADIAIDTLLRDRLCGARPDYGWLSEESEDDRSRLERKRVWIVDPIDGTRAFMDQRPEFTVAAALVENGRPVLGVVHNPITAELFEAVKDQGAHCNGTALHVPNDVRLDEARLLASQRALKHQTNFGDLPRAQFKFINSIAYRMSLVAFGRFDATISLAEKSDWDIAAAELIVTEAGARAAAPDGSPFIYNRQATRHPGVVAAGPALFGEILDRL